MAVDRASLRVAETFLREGQADKALELYRELANRQFADGFYAQAGALFKKILKLCPDDEPALVRLGDVAARQGMVAEARTHYTALATRRSERGDRAGAAEMTTRLVAMDTAVALPLLSHELRAGNLEAARARIVTVLRSDPAARASIAPNRSS